MQNQQGEKHLPSPSLTLSAVPPVDTVPVVVETADVSRSAFHCKLHCYLQICPSNQLHLCWDTGPTAKHDYNPARLTTLLGRAMRTEWQWSDGVILSTLPPCLLSFFIPLSLSLLLSLSCSLSLFCAKLLGLHVLTPGTLAVSVNFPKALLFLHSCCICQLP